MEAHIEDLWLVFVTSNFKRNPTDPEAMRTRDFAEVIGSESFSSQSFFIYITNMSPPFPRRGLEAPVESDPHEGRA